MRYGPYSTRNRGPKGCSKEEKAGCVRALYIRTGVTGRLRRGAAGTHSIRLADPRPQHLHVRKGRPEREFLACLCMERCPQSADNLGDAGRTRSLAEKGIEEKFNPL